MSLTHMWMSDLILECYMYQSATCAGVLACAPVSHPYAVHVSKLCRLAHCLGYQADRREAYVPLSLHALLPSLTR